MITKITVDAAISRHMAQFMYEDDSGKHGAFQIQTRTEGGNTYFEVHDRPDISDHSTWTQQAYENWGESLEAWNRLAVAVVQDMDPDARFSGPQVQRITGLSAPGVTVTCQRVGVEGQKLGRTLMYTPSDLVKIYQRSTIEGRPAGGMKSRKALLRKAVRENPNAVDARRMRVTIQHYGLEGPPRALGAIAKDEGVTRERVRQLTSETVSILMDLRPPKHVRRKEKDKEMRARKHMSIDELFGVEEGEPVASNQATV